MTPREYLLGKRVEYPVRYAPELLFPVERHENRAACGIDDRFHGYDAWHAREVSFITRHGLPVVGILKIVYPASSRFIVESKSLKLYLHSLNMTPLGDDVAEGIESFVRVVRGDLERVVQAPVAACFFADAPGERPFDFEDYIILEQTPEVTRASFDYARDPALLLADPLPAGEIKVGSHLLRSNCKITGQPDWGSIFIHAKGERLPSPVALARHVVSLRGENHFHEEICEIVYQHLQEAFAPGMLSVSCLYTRRGGIDICPSRASNPTLLPRGLGNPTILTRGSFRQ
ncbi:MAG: NADPH-dependent 7-cyano-7-deazaguanine reductase QueF [Odoribacteraceae bacterium]|jgi:7-cyano-7-deazaguanine reductase|nr:NADPH-dependent 7-cyano-7-deazaguanine reductase QueF [Odoribacteraceae bacterium]